MASKKLLSLMVPTGLLAGTLVLGGCNTVEGMGQDIAALGNTMSGASRDVRSEDDKGKSKDKKTVEEQARAERYDKAEREARAEQQREGASTRKG